MADQVPRLTGTSDQVVPFTRATESVEDLRALGFGGIELQAYPNMPHSLCAQEQADIAAFIEKVSIWFERSVASGSLA